MQRREILIYIIGKADIFFGNKDFEKIFFLFLPLNSRVSTSSLVPAVVSFSMIDSTDWKRLGHSSQPQLEM